MTTAKAALAASVTEPLFSAVSAEFVPRTQESRWTLLHLIETGPNPVLRTKPAPDANEWHHRLYDRGVFEELNATT
ncbi:hypothetical protein ACFYZ5_40870 [Streptomyces chartreusis]|uniref:hypothetical protein n=1 Tax=Streptomyces chartreusis TaxID=1969 RepID=UPI0036BAC3C6